MQYMLAPWESLIYTLTIQEWNTQCYLTSHSSLSLPLETDMLSFISFKFISTYILPFWIGKNARKLCKMTSFHKENLRKICICFNQSKTLREQSSHGEATISLGYVIFTLDTTPIGGSTSLFNNPSLPWENVLYCIQSQSLVH